MTLNSLSKQYDGIMYIGSYGTASEPTIRVCSFNGNTGEITVIQEVNQIENASYLALNPAENRLYAVSETDQTGNEPGGSAIVYAIEDNGKLRELNRQLTHGEHPCYISTDKEGTAIYVANYTGGNAASLPIGEDGVLEPAAAIIKQEASLGTNVERQDAPHAHAIVPNGASPYVYVTDLGTDLIHCYRAEEKAGLVYQSCCKLHSGAGPRHIVFHNELPFAYVINELDSTITVLSVHKDSGELVPAQTISALPADYNGYNDAADIHLSPSGQFLYSSNRGHNSIAVFAVNQENGQLAVVQHEACGGEGPRNFAITPDGRQLLVANQKSGTIILFTINESTGQLQSKGPILEVPSPVCIRLTVH